MIKDLMVIDEDPDLWSIHALPIIHSKIKLVYAANNQGDILAEYVWVIISQLDDICVWVG